MKQLYAAIALMFLSGGTSALASDDMMSWKLVRSERVDSVGNVRCIYEMKLASGEVLTRVQIQLHLCTWLPKLE